MCGDVTNYRFKISSFARPMVMRLGKLVTYGEMNAPIKSHVPLATWSLEITQQTKTEIFLPSENVWAPKFARC